MMPISCDVTTAIQSTHVCVSLVAPDSNFGVKRSISMETGTRLQGCGGRGSINVVSGEHVTVARDTR